jgi:c-di-GMP-related signal transduction protein
MKNFIARQPIFRQDQEVLGYEVLFRADAENGFSEPHQDAATLSVDTLLQFGLDRVISGRLAFINCSSEFLRRDYLTLLPPDRVVGEILETVPADQEMLDACRRLKRAGYHLAVDDFAGSPQAAPFLDVADYVKVDFVRTSPLEQARLAKALSRRDLLLVAEKVETQEARRRAISMGYGYFQGYFFCRPQVAQRQTIAAQKLNYLRVLQIVNRPEFELADLADAIKVDASLTFRLLRYLNSPLFALRTSITSIQHALALLGEQAIRKWISLVSVSAMGEDKPTETIMVPLIRARFCELIATATTLRAKADQLFLMGLLSAMDALLDTPMTALLSEIPVADEIKDALLGKAGSFRDVYEIVSNYEAGTWEPLLQAVKRVRINEEVIAELFLKSLDWANQVSSLASE